MWMCRSPTCPPANFSSKLSPMTALPRRSRSSLSALRPSVMPRGLRGSLLTAMLATALIASVHAQRYFREGSYAPQYAPAFMPDAEFTACRLQYTRVRYEAMGLGWLTDY